MASAEVNVQIKRIGKVLHIYSNGKFLTSIDLQEHYKLSDEDTSLLVAKLDECNTEDTKEK